MSPYPILFAIFHTPSNKLLEGESSQNSYDVNGLASLISPLSNCMGVSMTFLCDISKIKIFSPIER